MKEIKAADFDDLVLHGDKVVLDFYSTECPPCEALAPKFESLDILWTTFASDISASNMIWDRMDGQCFGRRRIEISRWNDPATLHYWLG